MLTEEVIQAVKKKYEIPDKTSSFSISEEVEDDSYGCCHNYSSYIETRIFYEYVPEGKKRKIKRYHTYTGTVWELIQELDML